MPGFRPGKVPRKIFEAQYGSGAIVEQALEKIIPIVYDRVIREETLEPIGRPEMELLPVEEGAPLRVRALVSVRPPIELGKYRGLELTGGPLAASDEQVEAALERLRREEATLVSVDRPAALGDIPTLDFEAKIDGVPFAGAQAKNEPMELTEGRYLPGFLEGVLGMSAGESKEISATFPEAYPAAELAGKTAVFTVTLHENKAAELPDLDDAFAARYGPAMTLQDLRKDVRAQLDQEVEEATQRAMAEQAVGLLLDTHDFELPELLSEAETEHLMRELRANVEQRGEQWETYLAETKTSEAELRAERAQEAARRVKTTLLIEAIAKAEEIRPTWEDIQAEGEALSRHYRRSRESIAQKIEQNPGAFLDGIIRSKTISFLLEHAVIDGVSPEDRAAQATSEATSSADAEATGSASA